MIFGIFLIAWDLKQALMMHPSFLIRRLYGGKPISAWATSGLWPKADMANQYLCKSMGTDLGTFSSLSKGAPELWGWRKSADVLSQKENDIRFQDMLNGEYNVAWHVLQIHSFLQDDAHLAEFQKFGLFILIGYISTFWRSSI